MAEAPWDHPADNDVHHAMNHLDLTGASGYSMPLGASLYPPPPYHYKGALQAWASYEGYGDEVRSLLPPGVEPAGDPPLLQAWVNWYPWSMFGPYHEAYIMVEVTLDGDTYWYQPVIFTDSEVPLTAGREIWGYAKKLAVMSWDPGGSQLGGALGEQLLFTVERPAGKRIMTFTMSVDRQAGPDEFDAHPVLSTRYLPASDPSRSPAAAELVSLDVEGTTHSSPGLGLDFWAGRASVVMDSPSEVDPWFRLRPRRLLGGWTHRADFSLPLGRVVKDYLEEGAPVPLPTNA
jgi:acetoacetate decarboxylase